MTPGAALAFVEKHGVVLASGKGPVPSLAEAVASEPIKGSWWAHPKGKQIFAALGAASESADVLVCRLAGGKITLVHRRLWPALARLAQRLPAQYLARVRQEHTAAGHHRNREQPFPDWVPAQVLREAKQLSEEQALAALGTWALEAPPRRRKK